MTVKRLPDNPRLWLRSNHTKKQSYRPYSLILLIFYGLLFTGWNGIRLVQGIYFWKTLVVYNISPGAWYICLSSGIWLILSLIAGWGLWFETAWASSIVLMNVFGFAIWYWFDRLVFQYAHSNIPFALLATGVLITLPIILLLSPGSKRVLLKGNNDRKLQI